MARIQWKGSALLSPVPAALVTSGSGDEANVMTAAWCGITCTQPPVTYVSIRPERHSYGLIKEGGEFVLHLTTEALCRVYTGAKVNKFEKYGLTRLPSTCVAPPTIEEAPVALECRVRDIIPLGTHDMFLADIVAVTVREELLDASGRLCLERAGLVAYAHGAYFGLGKKLGGFGYSVKKAGRGRR